MTEQPADVVAAEKALEAAIRSHDADDAAPLTVAEALQVLDDHTPKTVAEVLQAFLDTHSPSKSGHATNANGSWETDETVYCQCALCVAGRAALSV